MRPKPTISAPTIEKKERPDYVTEVREYELITPLFGGGVEPGVVDLETPISGKAIRGQLRFWWRATRGGEFNGLLEEMKKREDEIWGGSGKFDKVGNLIRGQSKVLVSVVNHGTLKGDKPFLVDGKARKESRVPAYAAFPLQPSLADRKKEAPVKEVQFGAKFTLTLHYPKDVESEVKAALWAWEIFGGVGARTRRGFGAIKLTSENGKPSQLPDPKSFGEKFLSTNHVSDGPFPDGVPHLSRNLQHVVFGPKSDPIDCWRDLIAKLNNFRQYRLDKKTGKKSDYGKSVWPEPTAIRTLESSRGRRHADPEIFPRAVFGLPIIFHFPLEKDPPDYTLKGLSMERLASPLILRPVACTGNQFVGLVAILMTPQIPPNGLLLEDDKKTIAAHNVQHKLTPEIARRIPPLNGETDVLKAFLAFIKK